MGFQIGVCEDFLSDGMSLRQMNDLSKKSIFINRTKVETYTKKYIFVWKKFVGK